MLSTYRYIRILCCFIALCHDSYTTVFIFICQIAHLAPLQGSYLLVFYPYLSLKTHILILDVLYLIVTIRNGLLMLSLGPNDCELVITSQIMYHLDHQLPSNMRKQRITAVVPKVFCFWLLTRKQKLIHPLFIDVNVELFQVFWLIHRCNRSGYTTRLILLGVVFFTKIILTMFAVFCCTVVPAHIPGTSPGLAIDGHNVQIYCVKSKWHNRRHFIIYHALNQHRYTVNLFDEKDFFAWAYQIAVLVI